MSSKEKFNEAKRNAEELAGTITDLVEYHDVTVLISMTNGLDQDVTNVFFRFKYEKDVHYYVVEIKDPEPGNSEVYIAIGREICSVFQRFVDCDLPDLK